MLRVSMLFAALAALVSPHTASAQASPNPPYYAMDPHSPMTPSGNSPLQQQILENYRTQLLQSQRTLSQQDPAGTSRTQIDINHQLNQYGATPATPVMPPPPAPALGR